MACLGDSEHGMASTHIFVGRDCSTLRRIWMDKDLTAQQRPKQTCLIKRTLSILIQMLKAFIANPKVHEIISKSHARTWLLNVGSWQQMFFMLVVIAAQSLLDLLDQNQKSSAPLERSRWSHWVRCPKSPKCMEQKRIQQSFAKL